MREVSQFNFLQGLLRRRLLWRSFLAMVVLFACSGAVMMWVGLSRDSGRRRALSVAPLHSNEQFREASQSVQVCVHVTDAWS